jgi:cystathionine beta-lyase
VSSSLILDDGRYRWILTISRKRRRIRRRSCLSSAVPTTRWAGCGPGGLTRVGEICLKHGVLVVADEIHADLIYKGITFTPFAAISDALAQNTVVCTAPSKTFNLAGLHTSNIIIPNPTHRRRFQRTLESCGMGKWANPFGVLACETAYREGEPWLEQVMAYIEDNLDYLQDFIDNHLPGIRVIRPRAPTWCGWTAGGWGWISGRSSA